MKKNKKNKKKLVYDFFDDPLDLLGQGTKSGKNKKPPTCFRNSDGMDLL